MQIGRPTAHFSVRLGVVALLVGAIGTWSVSPTVAQNGPGGQAPQAQKTPVPRPAVTWSTIAQTEVMPVDNFVFVRAKLISVAPPDPGSRQPYSLYIQDNTGTRRVVVWQQVWEQLANPSVYQSGLVVDVYGKVGEYRGQRQIEVNDPRWIRVAPIRQSLPNSAFREGASKGAGDIVAQSSIGAINLAAIGKKVRVRGVVQEVNASPAPRVPEQVLLKDHTGEIQVIYWTDVIEKLPKEKRPVVGQPYEATGIVGEWRGKLQIKVAAVEDIGPPAVNIPTPTEEDGMQFPAGG